MTIMPHNHEMTAIIGVYIGGEDNIFWRRTGDALGLIKAASARSLRAKLDWQPLAEGYKAGVFRYSWMTQEKK